MMNSSCACLWGACEALPALRRAQVLWIGKADLAAVPAALFPAILMFCCIGIYSINSLPTDVMFIGVIYPLVGLVLALDTLESLHRLLLRPAEHVIA